MRERFADVFESLGGLEPLRGRFKPVTSTELAEIEGGLGVQLPALYREFLLEIGGVHFGEQVVVKMIQKSHGGGPENRQTIDSLYGAISEKQLALARNIKFWREEDRFSDSVIPIGEDVMGNLI